MLQKFWSKAQMSFFVPLERFEAWPEGTYSFCPRCAMDSFELLYQNKTDAYVRCCACGKLWIIKPSLTHIRYDAVVV